MVKCMLQQYSEKSSKDIIKYRVLENILMNLGGEKFSHSLINYFPQMLKD